MSSPAAVVCREIFDENSQPSAEEISDYAHQLGIDPESESHLLPLARDGLMQPLPAPWKAYFDEKLQTHYYYNEDTKKTQWEHPLDLVYRELVKKARDVSMQDDTCASVQELPTSEDYTKHLERVETKAESDDEFSTDSENHVSDVRDNASTLLGPRRLAPLGRPPISPLNRFDKKLSDLRISPLRRSVESPSSPKPVLVRNTSDRDLLSRPPFERPKMLYKQQSEIIDLKMHVLTSPEEENFSPLLTAAKVDKGLPLTGKGSMFFKLSKSDLPSPETDRSYPLDSLTKSDPPKGILREKPTESLHRKADAVLFGRPKIASFEDDRKSVRFKLENPPEPTISPGSNSSSEQNDNQSSIISAPVPSPMVTSQARAGTSSPMTSVPLSGIVLSSLRRPPLPPRHESPRESIESDSHQSLQCNSSHHSNHSNQSHQSNASHQSNQSHHSNQSHQSTRRRVVRPPAADYIKSDLFQKNFQKISDLVRPGDIEPTVTHLEEPVFGDKEARPRSPMIPQKNKISINLMESIESETSIDSPDREFANLDLNDLDESNDTHKDKPSENESKDAENKDSPKEKDDSKATERSESKSHRETIPQIKVPSLDLPRHLTSDTENSKSLEESKLSKSSIDIPKSPLVKISPTPSLGSEMRSPRLDFSKPWSPLSTFKPLNKAVIAPQMKSSDTNVKGLTSPRLDGVIISQGKSSSDNVVVVYQFETQDESYSKPIKSPLIPDMARDMIERNKADERRRLELSMQKELENLRVEWSVKERKMRAELQEELKAAEEKFLADKRVRLSEQADRHRREMEEELTAAERNHQQSLQSALTTMDEKYKHEIESAERQHIDNMSRLKNEYKDRLMEQQRQLEIENEHALSELKDQLHANLSRERARISEENRATIDSLKEENIARVADLRHDYRAEVEHLRMQHLCHLEEVRSRLAQSRAAPLERDRALQDKYRCLKEKYARLKHDVKMSIERRNKRREMSMTTGSETEKSNSHKANTLERCKEINETSVSVAVEPEPARAKPNPNVKCNDNETSCSESNAHKSIDNNNDDWKLRRIDIALASGDNSVGSGKARGTRRANVAFREPLARRRRDKDGDTGATTDCQDSSDATTADEKPKESVNGHGRRRCFTRLKSASTSRLNYSPKRGEGWSSPLESLRQQLRKLDDLEDQFPDLACQPAYSLRYPFSEIGAVSTADTAELEFVRHRALVEREGMRRARAVLRRRRAALQDTRTEREPHRAPSEEREATELEVALHRARALLGEKEIRLRHIERALRQLSPHHSPATHQAPEATASEGSSGSEAGKEVEAGGAVLRSLRALHADVRDIWRALDARRGQPVSPETSSCNPASTSQTRLTLSAPDPMIQDNSDGGVSERARGLRAWLQTAP